MRLILIRHGQTPANVAYTMHTTLPGPQLTRLSQQQAAALCQHPRQREDRRPLRLHPSTH
ncbi:phosphoglycerate mutase family protein [Streptomyces sp. NPDC088246]|uniref:phosphoglycerate mutase family protein n=1 Tax=Streptomyces sp. NPDC088246 TaxID=3365842 RepID=UPI00380973BF